MYDSSNTYISEKIIAQLMRSNEKVLNVHMINVAKQSGSQDCGLYALAFLTSIAHSNNPSLEVYRQEEMQEHLLTCFEKKEMTCFPVMKNRRVKNAVMNIVQIEIYCMCRSPYSEDEVMVCCDSCDLWYHTHCLSDDSKKDIKKNWFCSKCSS